MPRFSGVVIFQSSENCWLDCPARRSLVPLGKIFDRSTMEVPVAISTLNDTCAVLADMANLNDEAFYDSQAAAGAKAALIHGRADLLARVKTGCSIVKAFHRPFLGGARWRRWIS
uniref:Uncharacterized protein n=2 Tax=Pseudomonas aeruginosa TaxID=287 RepID=A0A7S5YC67_PSEAI|nr:hypothetical protein [Pseudomonas aeruginosa]